MTTTEKLANPREISLRMGVIESFQMHNKKNYRDQNENTFLEAGGAGMKPAD